MKRIAVVGVGLLGSAVASRLLEGGFTVVGYDSLPGSGDTPRGARTPAAASAETRAAGADAIFTILPTPDSVEAAVLSPAAC